MAAAKAGAEAAIDATPVDTGNARANWHLSFGGPSDEVESLKGNFGVYPDTIPPSTAFAKQRIAEDLAGFRLDSDPDVIFINNNVKYIDRLDQGYSRKGGFMAAAALVAARAALRRPVGPVRGRPRGRPFGSG